jgi:hypothetical protein
VCGKRRARLGGGGGGALGAFLLGSFLDFGIGDSERFRGSCPPHPAAGGFRWRSVTLLQAAAWPPVSRLPAAAPPPCLQWGAGTNIVSYW